MAIRKRITARFHKRVRTAAATDASGSDTRREESDARDLPVAGTRSGLVAIGAAAPRPAKAPTTRPARVPSSGSIRLSTYLRDARARAEQILREHPRSDTASTCQLCSLAYPCDAVRAAEDVIEISAKLRLDRLGSSRDLLELMTDLVDLGTTGNRPISVSSR